MQSCRERLLALPSGFLVPPGQLKIVKLRVSKSRFDLKEKKVQLQGSEKLSVPQSTTLTTTRRRGRPAVPAGPPPSDPNFGYFYPQKVPVGAQQIRSISLGNNKTEMQLERLIGRNPQNPGQRKGKEVEVLRAEITSVLDCPVKRVTFDHFALPRVWSSCGDAVFLAAARGTPWPPWVLPAGRGTVSLAASLWTTRRMWLPVLWSAWL